MSSGLGRWWRTGDSARGTIVRNATVLTSTTGVNLLLGFAYWWVAAISAMTLIAALSLFGFGTLLIGELPRRPGYARSLILYAVLIAGSSALLLGIIFAWFAPAFSTDFTPLRQLPFGLLAFALGASLTAISLIVDDVAVGLLYSELQLARSLTFGAAKLIFLIMALWFVVEDIALIAAWTLGIVVSLVVYLAVAARKFNLRFTGWKPQKIGALNLARSAMTHHFLNFTLELPRLGLPILVTSLISSTANAYFYTSLMIISVASAVTHALTKALYASNSSSPTINVENIRFSLLISLAISLTSTVAIVLASPLIMSVFGSEYRDNASVTLALLGLLPVSTSVSTHFVAVHRSLAQAHKAIPLTVLGTIARFILSGFGAITMGLEGLAIGLLISSYLETSLMAPFLWKVTRTGRR